MYNKLLLINGGGVTSMAQKSKQAKNCANIVIGLGGTGTFCTKMIKTQSFQRLRFNGDDTNGRFHRIKFLSIDTDIKADGQNDESNIMGLDADEIVNIEDHSLIDALHDGVQWQDWVPKDGSLKAGSGAGASGVRPLGRLYLAGNAQKVITRIQNIYNEATSGLAISKMADGASRAYIHVISGMGGGTGSGTFLDLCYMLKEYFPDANIIGYFFLPQVNEDVVAAADVKAYIRNNGYGAMQDLDYCMSLAKNHGAFDQVYNTSPVRPIPWSSAPVHLCHIISNQGAVMNGHGKTAYNYAMNVVTEYLLDFFVDAAGKDHDMISEISNADTKMHQAEAKRTCGYNCNYSSMGSSCAIVPFREINTYLTARLFSEFNKIFTSRGTAFPIADDIMRIACNAYARGGMGQNAVYDGILRQLYNKANPTMFAPFQYDIKDVDWNNIVTDKDMLARMGADIQIPRQLYDHYEPRLNQKIGVYETNMKSMLDINNSGSLLGQIKRQLNMVACDVTKGPAYAYGAIKRAEKGSLVNIIDGLIAQNIQTLNNKELNIQSRVAEYNNAVLDAKTAGSLSLKKKSAIAEEALIGYMAQLSEVHMFRRLGKILYEFKKQLITEADTYYIRLLNVFNELMETFLQNEKDIESDTPLAVDTSYAEYLLTMDQIKKTLDEEIAKSVPNVPDAFGNFMTYLMRDRDMLFTENKAQFCDYIVQFFVDTEHGLFNSFVNKTIDDYLRMAYAHDNSLHDYTQVTNDNVTQYVQARLQNLFNKARPLFETNSKVQDTGGLTMSGWVTIPSISAAIQQAAANTNINYNLIVNPSAVTDRIFIEMRHDGVSLSAISGIPIAENNVPQNSKLHSYLGMPQIPGKFRDWGKLAPLSPIQFFNSSNVTLKYVEDYVKVFDDAMEAGLIKITSQGQIQYYGVSEDKAAALIKAGEDLTAAIRSAANLAELSASAIKDGIAALEENVAGALEMIEEVTELKAEYKDPMNDPDGMKYTTRFYRDLFVKAPQLVMDTQAQIERMEKLQAAVADVKPLYEARFKELKSGSLAMDAFCLALFTGIIDIVGNDLSYSWNERGKTNEEKLSCMKELGKFPFAVIPSYQAYLSFKNMDPELKEQIWNMANDKENDLYADPAAVLDTKIEAFMKRINGWYNQTAKFAEKAEIEKFLADLYDQFENFKMNHSF
ncbi:MAG: hypothetical protein IJK40_08445 [Clostridia bacterium]|nr:hypothetical protein [Clostridia bacterium]